MRELASCAPLLLRKKTSVRAGVHLAEGQSYRPRTLYSSGERTMALDRWIG